MDPLGYAPARLFMHYALIAMHDSTLRTSCVQGQLVGVALSFLRNFGILSGASGVLGALSSGVASAALDDRFAVQRAQQKQVGPLLQLNSVSGCCVPCHCAPASRGYKPLVACVWQLQEVLLLSHSSRPVNNAGSLR